MYLISLLLELHLICIHQSCTCQLRMLIGNMNSRMILLSYNVYGWDTCIGGTCILCIHVIWSHETAIIVHTSLFKVYLNNYTL